VLGVDKDFAIPETLDDFRPAHQVPVCRYQQNEQFQWLFFQPHAAPRAAQLKTVAIQPEGAEFENSDGH